MQKSYDIKTIIKKILKYPLVLIIGIALGLLFLNLVYILPDNVMYNNLKRSAYIIEHEREYEQIAASQIDNFSDSIMLANAIYDGNESVLEKSIKVYRKSADNDNPQKSLAAIISDSNVKSETIEYGRYWHGYLIFLKPLLMIFTYNDIRTINTIILPLMLLTVCILLNKNSKSEYILPYIISAVLMNPAAIMMSMQFSTIFYIYNISIIFMLYNRAKKRKYDIALFFLVVGMSTSYFDLSTYPLTSWGMPMIVLLVLHDELNWLEKIKTFFKSGIFWAIGYIGMWVGKWSIGSILLKENLFSDALNQIHIRTSNSVEFLALQA